MVSFFIIFQTTTSRASLFCSTYPLMLLGYMKYKGTKLSWGEIIGVLISVVGIVVSELSELIEGGSQQNFWTQFTGSPVCTNTSDHTYFNIKLRLNNDVFLYVLFR